MSSLIFLPFCNLHLFTISFTLQKLFSFMKLRLSVVGNESRPCR